VAFEHVFYLIEERLALGQGVAVLGAGELAQELLLFFGQLAGHLDQDLDELVAVAGGAEVGEALALELEDLAVLGAGGEVEVLAALEGRDVEASAQGGLGEADGELADEVVVVAALD